MDGVAGKDGPHGDGGIGQALGRGQNIRNDVEILAGERRAQSPETGDDLIKNEQDAVGAANTPLAAR